MAGVRPSAGTVIADRYRLLSLLGEGGMGEVWAARHVLTGKAVAVKRLTCAMHDHRFDEARARFALEARSACAVEHPNVVEIFDFIEREGEAPVIVMELLEGETLAARLARGALGSPREVARVMLPVVSAVGTAHERGIVHRDLKPSNIFIGPRRGEAGVKITVLDFGIAKWLARSHDEQGLRTRTGSTLGTPSYMAPEQATGERSADHRVDVWSLGVILYEALSGVRPLEGENAAQLVMRLLSSGIMPLEHLVPDLPPELASLVGRMLSRDVARRPRDLREVFAVLGTLAEQDGLAFGAPQALLGGDDAQPPAAFPRPLPGVDAFARTQPRDPQAPTLTASDSASSPPTHAGLATSTPDESAIDLPPPGPRRRLARLSAGALALGLATALLVLGIFDDTAADPGAAAAGFGPARGVPAPSTIAVSTQAAGATPALHAETAGPEPERAAAPPALPQRAAPSALTSQAARDPSLSREASARRRQQRKPARKTRQAAAAPAPPGVATRPAHEVTAAAAVASPPAAPREKPAGSECERSSECRSRLCVAYACQ